MPRRCSVPGCKSNYDKTIRKEGCVPMVKFPDDKDLKDKWLRAIRRKDFTPTRHTGICLIHFHPEDFRDSTNRVPTTRRRLQDNAVPSIFPSFPSYLNRPPIKRRRDPDIRRKEQAFEKAKQEFRKFEADRIKTFENFIENFRNKLDITNWQVLKNDMKVVFYRVVLTEDTDCEICTRIIITKDLHLKVILGDIELRLKDLEWVIGTNIKLVRWSQVAKVLSRYLGEETVPNRDRDYYLHYALTFLKQANECEDDFKYSSNIELLCNQITLIKSKQPRYDIPAIIMSFLIYSQSVPAYEILRKFLIMPCRRYLLAISSITQPIHNNKISITDESFLGHIVDNLKIREKYVALLLHAIYIGMDASDPTVSKTLIVFMIKSLYGPFKKVVRLFPISSPSGADLKQLTIETINFVQRRSFKVIVVTTDNNKTNQSLFQMLTENESNKPINYFVNPGYSEEMIYLKYDTIQIYKNFRNDWILLSDIDQTFFYPDFETGEVKSASFIHLKNVFSEELNLPNKQAYKLNKKSLQPDSVERQNLTLVENVFHPSTILALKQHDGDMAETGEFCAIIRKWWDVMNVKGTSLQITNTDDDKSPFYSSHDARLEFLDKFISWLELWSSTVENGNEGILTSDTSNAAILTTKTVIDLIKYSLDVLKVEYVLPAMLQTDDLEVYFRSYRGLESQSLISNYTALKREKE